MEAAEQSERLSVPVVCPPAPLLQAPGPPVVTARPSDPIRRAKPGAGWPEGRMAGWPARGLLAWSAAWRALGLYPAPPVTTASHVPQSHMRPRRRCAGASPWRGTRWVTGGGQVLREWGGEGRRLVVCAERGGAPALQVRDGASGR